MARPFVTVHFAQSLDGHLDDCDSPQPIRLSNDEGFREAHRARAAHDAVLVGIGTVLRDDPKLLTSKIPGKHPHRVVFDSCLRTPAQARLLDRVAETRVIIFGCEGRCSAERVELLRSAGAEIHLMPASQPTARVPVVEALEHLTNAGITRLLVEGGARVIQSFLRAQCVDWLQIEIAPCIVGSTGLPGLGQLSGSVQLDDMSLRPLDKHILVCGRPRYTPPPAPND